MKCSRSEQCLKYSSVIGAHFVVAPLSFMWIYGNLSAYIDSYYRFACAPQCRDGDSRWTVGLAFAMICVGTLLTKHLAGKIGLKYTGVAAAVVGNASLFGTVWTVSITEAGTTALLGAVMGLVYGITTTVAFEYISGWAPEKSSLFIATILGMSTLISVPQNLIITAILNPRNLKPDVMLGSRTFFSQTEVLNRVPHALFIYAAMNFILQCIGYLLLAPQSSPSNFTSEKESPQTSVKQSKEGEKSLTMNNLKSSKLQIDVVHSGQNGTSTNKALGSRMELRPLNSIRRNEKQTSLKPSEVLKTPLFYAVFLFGMATMYAFSLKANYYKQFGLLYIHNDHYLTLVGTLIPIVASTSRFILGWALNKRLVTIKSVIIFNLSVNSVLCAFWYFVPQYMYSEVLYMILILGLAFVQSLFYLILPVAALQKFGPDHFSTNYGMLLLCLFIVGFLSPAVGSPLLHTYGWYWLFISASTLTLLSLLLAVCVNFNPIAAVSDA